MTKPKNITKVTCRDIFFPGLDEGAWRICQRSLAPSQVDPLKARFLNLNTDSKIASMNRHWIDKNKPWRNGYIFPTVLLYSDDVSIYHRHTIIRGKYLLNSSNGWRFLRRLMVSGAREAPGPIAREEVEYLDRRAQRNNSPIANTDIDTTDLDLIVESRTFSNYYHFLRETVPLLELYKEYKLQGFIYLHNHDRKEITRFAEDLLSEWYPDLKSKIKIVGDLNRYEHGPALFPFDSFFYYAQSSPKVVPDIVQNSSQYKRRFFPKDLRALGNHSTEEALKKFAARARAEVTSMTMSEPYIYIRRKSHRDRPIIGEAKFEAALQEMGFKTICFEDYSVKQQAALMKSAKIVVATHGAGVANLAFMSSGSHFVELTNFQILRQRYGDFNALALASSVWHHHIAIDHDQETDGVVPVLRINGMRGVRFSGFTLGVSLAYIRSLMLGPDSVSAAIAECRSMVKQGDAVEVENTFKRNGEIIGWKHRFYLWKAEAEKRLGNYQRAEESIFAASCLFPDDHRLERRLEEIRNMRTMGQDMKG